MSADNPKSEGPVNKNRRLVLQSIASGAVVTTTLATGSARAQDAVPTSARSAPSDPNAAAARATSEMQAPQQGAVSMFVDRPGSDYMVDVIKSLDVEYIALNPGSSFRGLQESISNYGGNRMPEIITCPHEEIAVAVAHGYALASNKPMMAMMHECVGVQHGAMAIYNAFADRVPVLMLTAANTDAAWRRPFAEWQHGVQDGAATVRDFTKWDDQPGSLTHFGESLVRGYQIASSPPMGPVLIAADMELQEKQVAADIQLSVPKRTMATLEIASPGAIEEIARLLVTAQNPLILAGRYANNDTDMAMLVQLAELVNAPVADIYGRFNFPTQHYLNQTSRLRLLVPEADFILALEPISLELAIATFKDQATRTSIYNTRPEVKIFTLGHYNILRSNYQDFERYVAVALHVNGDAAATMPLLVEAVRRRKGGSERSLVAGRGQHLREASEAVKERTLAAAKVAWNASPLTTGRVTIELWDAIKNEDWAMVNPTFGFSDWPQRLWPMTKYYHNALSTPGAGGLGGFLPRSVGAALAYKAEGRFCVSIQGDGDFMYTSGSLWTAAHHRIPMLIILHNNRGYYQETMHLIRMAAERQRSPDRSRIGTLLDEPNIDYAMIARGMGVFGVGPITSGIDLGPALRRAVAVVKRGETALIDVVTQPR